MFGATSDGLVRHDELPLTTPASNNFNWAFLIFQTVFCATAATIVSGAMAERTKFASYLIYTVVDHRDRLPDLRQLGVGQPARRRRLAGRALGFHDFAGSTVVHSIGGWAALAGAIVLGPRIGKYNGKQIDPHPRPQHSAGRPGRVHPLAGLVRLQPGQHHGRRRRQLRFHRRDHQHRGGRPVPLAP